MEKLKGGRHGEMKHEGYNRSTKIKHNSWSDLPIELLGGIMEKQILGHADQVRFSAVCKNWMLSYTNYQKQLTHQVPALLTCSFVPKSNWFLRCSCQLYDPYNLQPFENYEVGKMDSENMKLDKWTVTAKYGWVFFSRVKARKPDNFTQFFLFSVSTKKIIPLPHLEHGKLIISTTITTFSSDPNCPNCIFFVLRESKSSKISISTFSPQNGDRRWITTKLKRKIRFSIESVVYMQGSLYCLSELWNLAAYNVASREWNVLENSYRISTGGRGIRDYESRMHESNGDLLLVRLDLDALETCTILRFDFKVKHWVSQWSLSDRAVFIGRNSSFSVPVVEGTRHTILGNRVYYLGHEGGCKVYSFKEKGELVYCEEGSRFKGWNVDILGGECIWIEPRDHLVKPA